MKADHERDKEEFAAIDESKIDKKDFYTQDTDDYYQNDIIDF